MFSFYLFKINYKIDEKCNAKGMPNSGIWKYIAEGYWENKPLSNLPYFTFWLLFTKR